MHELAITKKIMQMIEDEVKKKKTGNPKVVTIEVGYLTTFKSFVIKQLFDVLKKDSKFFKETELIAIEIPGIVKCKDCGAKREVEEPFFMLCPSCTSTNIEVVQGDDIKIREMKV